MFGFEKKKEGTNRIQFEFDLEKDIKRDPKIAQTIQKEAQWGIDDLQNKIREGAHKEHYKDYGILLKGYQALEKIIKRITE